MSEGTTQEPRYTKAERNRHFVTAGLLALALLFIDVLNPSGAYSLSGEYIEGGSARMTRIFATFVLVSTPLMSAVLALGVAALPYRGLPYLRKYPRALLVTLIGVYAILSAIGTLKLLRIYLGF